MMPRVPITPRSPATCPPGPPIPHLKTAYARGMCGREEERLASVRALGLSAANTGSETVYLVDENREELAMWTSGGGAKLMGSSAADDAEAVSAAQR